LGINMQTIRYELDADGIATLTFDEPDSPVNTMRPEWQDDMAEAAAQLERDKERISGVLLASAKTTFFAGAELKGVLKLGPEDAAEGFKRIEALKRSFRRIETLGKPVVALLNGAALGGGWEVALIAHARFALDDRKIQFGTPEVSLGLIPGATGITKTVRMLGLMAAQPFLLEGRLFGPREAVELGWVQGLANDAAQLRSMALDWIAANPQATQPWDRKDYKMPGGTRPSPKIAAGPGRRARDARGEDARPVPGGARDPRDDGRRARRSTTTPATRIESRKLAKIMVRPDDEEHGYRVLLQPERDQGPGKSRPTGVPKWKPAKVGVLGAGMMGAGIAHACASRGFACVLKDASIEKARVGFEAVRKVTAPLVAKGKLSEQQQAEILNRVTPTADAADLQAAS
jgi:3-hydroxyacyl-CoA dehydrogenase/enoyl-CoA hydratase/3-hydroxybutyryl-CoA epimerase